MGWMGGLAEKAPGHHLMVHVPFRVRKSFRTTLQFLARLTQKGKGASQIGSSQALPLSVSATCKIMVCPQLIAVPLSPVINPIKGNESNFLGELISFHFGQTVALG